MSMNISSSQMLFGLPANLFATQPELAAAALAATPPQRLGLDPFALVDSYRDINTTKVMGAAFENADQLERAHQALVTIIGETDPHSWANIFADAARRGIMDSDAFAATLPANYEVLIHICCNAALGDEASRRLLIALADPETEIAETAKSFAEKWEQPGMMTKAIATLSPAQQVETAKAIFRAIQSEASKIYRAIQRLSEGDKSALQAIQKVAEERMAFCQGLGKIPDDSPAALLYRDLASVWNNIIANWVWVGFALEDIENGMKWDEALKQILDPGKPDKREFLNGAGFYEAAPALTEMATILMEAIEKSLPEREEMDGGWIFSGVTDENWAETIATERWQVFCELLGWKITTEKEGAKTVVKVIV